MSKYKSLKQYSDRDVQEKYGVSIDKQLVAVEPIPYEIEYKAIYETLSEMARVFTSNHETESSEAIWESEGGYTYTPRTIGIYIDPNDNSFRNLDKVCNELMDKCGYSYDDVLESLEDLAKLMR
jgi:hypothetical protein